MAMRYHWGLGIGHTYSHEGASCFQQPPIPSPVDESESEGDEDAPPQKDDTGPSNQDADSDHAESASDTTESSDSDDEAFLELHDTYYSD